MSFVFWYSPSLVHYEVSISVEQRHRYVSVLTSMSIDWNFFHLQTFWRAREIFSLKTNCVNKFNASTSVDEIFILIRFWRTSILLIEKKKSFSMRREEYLINENSTIVLEIDKALKNSSTTSFFTLLFIIWLYLILSCDNQIDLFLRLFRSNRFILWKCLNFNEENVCSSSSSSSSSF